jgi:hypothetical protein
LPDDAQSTAISICGGQAAAPPPAKAARSYRREGGSFFILEDRSCRSVCCKHWAVPFIDVCPDKPRSPRRKEILDWLSDHPRITRYAVIDDEDDELDELPLFQPSGQTGLTMDIVKAAEKYLNGETDKTLRASAVVRLGQNIHSLFKRNKS